LVQPSARNPSFKQLVATMRERMTEHVADAQRVASEIAGAERRASLSSVR
jgi:hypothetical protein